MNEQAAPAEAVNPEAVEAPTEEVQTDPWGGELSKTDAALLNETQDEDKDNGTDDDEKVREQDESEAEAVQSEVKAEAPKEEEQKDEKVVPYGALHEERQLRKEARAEANELREKMARMEEKFSTFQEVLKPKEPEVSFEDDPAEYLRKEAERTNQTLEQLQRQQQEAVQRQQAAAQNQQFISRYQTTAQQYAEANPDFHDAYNHLVEGRVKEHMLAGGMERNEAIQLAQREEQAIVARAFEQGENPAEKLVELAQLRGWTKQAQSAKVDKVAQVEKGQKAAKTISKGGQPEGKLTLEALADMEGDEFDKAWEKLIGPAS